MKLCVLTLFLSVLIIQNIQAQKNAVGPLTIGDKIPASIWKKVPRSENTKLIILDFWATSCSSCMDAFPKMEKLQRQFSKQLQIILVNSWETKTQIDERLKLINENRIENEEESINLPSIIAINGDTVFKKLFPTSSIPHHVWIDATGVVKFITHGHNATAKHIQRILEDEIVEMDFKKDIMLSGFNSSDGLFKVGYSEINAIFYSGFCGYNSGYGSGVSSIRDSLRGTIRRTYINQDVLGLYKTAFGSRRVLLNVKNSKDYQKPNWLQDGDILDEWNNVSIFSYEICVPFKEEKTINAYMKADLNRFFASKKNIEGHVEKKSFNCLVLTTTKISLLKTLGGRSIFKDKDTLIKLTNTSFNSILNLLTDRLEDMDAGRPFIDETGIDPSLKVDIELTGNLKDVENVRKQLRQYGLDIIEAERVVEVLVIRDKKVNGQ